jgi:hypothetical protein
MIRSRHRGFWWFLLITGVAGIVAVLALAVWTSYSLPAGWQWVMLPTVIAGVVGAVVADRRPQAPIGWIFLTVMWLTGIGALTAAVAELAAGSGDSSTFVLLCAAFATLYWPVQLLLATTFTVLLFPDGVASRRWRPVLWVAITATVALTVAELFAPSFPLADGADAPTIANPLAAVIGGGSQSASDAILAIGGVIGVACGIVGLVGILIRTWRSTGVLHLQLRWFTAAMVVAVISGFVPWNSSQGGNPFLSVGMTLIPISCGFAITRYHLYDIDRIISRTTSYAIVTGCVIATYAAIVAVASRLFHTNSPVVVAAATLCAAAIARPALRRVQDAVDRRFNRERYDAVHTVDAFGARLAHAVDPLRVSTDLINVVTSTLEPKDLSLWLKETP